MSKLEDYLVTQAGTSTAVGGRVRDSAIGNFPAIGDILLSPNEKFSDLGGITKFDQLICDGSAVDANEYPLLAPTLDTALGQINLAVNGNYPPACSDDGVSIFYTAVGSSASPRDLYKSVDGGNSYTIVYNTGTPAPTASLTIGLGCSDDGRTVAFVAGYLHVSFDYGVTWSSIDPDGYEGDAVAVSGDGTVIFQYNSINRRGYYYRESGGGGTLSVALYSSAPTGIAALSASGDNLFTPSIYGYSLGRTIWNGTAYVAQPETVLDVPTYSFPQTNTLACRGIVCGATENELYIKFSWTVSGGSDLNGAIYYSDDYGVTLVEVARSDTTDRLVNWDLSGISGGFFWGGGESYLLDGEPVLPDMTSPDPSIPYRIIGDLT